MRNGPRLKETSNKTLISTTRFKLNPPLDKSSIKNRKNKTTIVVHSNQKSLKKVLKFLILCNKNHLKDSQQVTSKKIKNRKSYDNKFKTN